MQVLTARYASQCSKCEHWINPGNPIIMRKGSAWHEDCAISDSMTAKVLMARFPSECAGCDKPIKWGDVIVWRGYRQAEHAIHAKWTLYNEPAPRVDRGYTPANTPNLLEALRASLNIAS